MQCLHQQRASSLSTPPPPHCYHSRNHRNITMSLVWAWVQPWVFPPPSPAGHWTIWRKTSPSQKAQSNPTAPSQRWPAGRWTTWRTTCVSRLTHQPHPHPRMRQMVVPSPSRFPHRSQPPRPVKQPSQIRLSSPARSRSPPPCPRYSRSCIYCCCASSSSPRSHPSPVNRPSQT